jgi:hypothetical protein
MTTPPLDPVYTIMAEHFLVAEPVDSLPDPIESLAKAIRNTVELWYVLHGPVKEEPCPPTASPG